MKALVITISIVVFSCTPVFAKGGGGHSSGSHNIKGYVKKDGTYVAPSHATNPNNSKSDNWSTKGNLNPYTGKAGAKDPVTGN
ncbi:MAG: hypothetical protein WC091_24825 [Sulfuricellaceae bacterium]